MSSSKMLKVIPDGKGVKVLDGENLVGYGDVQELYKLSFPWHLQIGEYRVEQTTKGNGIGLRICKGDKEINVSLDVIFEMSELITSRFKG